MKLKFKMDSYDGLCLCNGLVFFAPVSLLVRTQAGVSVSAFFVLQALLSGIIFLGEIPAGFLTDRIGCRKSLILSQALLMLARVLLFLAFFWHSFSLFVVEAIVEGISACFFSGTDSAYLYQMYTKDKYLEKRAHAANFGTAGFIISTLAYGLIYRQFDIGGLLVATIVSGAAAWMFSYGLKKVPDAGWINTSGEGTFEDTGQNVSPRVFGDTVQCVSLKSLIVTVKRLVTHKRMLLYVVMMSALSLAWLLINFFYVEKLLDCRIDVSWLSVIILVYSVIQLSGEVIIRKTVRYDRRVLSLGFHLLAAGLLILFGFIRGRAAVLLLMVILPLILDLSGYVLDEQENEFVDAIGERAHRASVLSVLNMGVNVVEMIGLFASAGLASLGVNRCFLFVGLLLLAGGVTLYVKTRKRVKKILTE